MNQDFKIKKILIVEDEDDYYYIVSSIIEKESKYKLELERVSDGKEGIEKILKNNYDLLILDIGLPYFNGIEVLKRARKHGIKTPVLIFTVRSEFEMLKEAISYGISGYIIKPFEPHELLNKIENAIKD